MEYSEMNVQQRAEHLLAKGVEAKLDIDPEAMAPGYAAHAIGIGKLPCGYHASEQDAIEAGTAWLRAKIDGCGKRDITVSAKPHNA